MSERVSVSTRPYRASDRAEVLALAPRLTAGVAPWRDGEAVLAAVRRWVEESLASVKDENHAVIVAELDGRIVGFAGVSTRTHFTGETDGYIGELVTAETAEGKGIGSRLLDAAEEWARTRGLKRLTLDTGSRNSRARRFYEERGYINEEVTLTKLF